MSGPARASSAITALAAWAWAACAPCAALVACGREPDLDIDAQPPDDGIVRGAVHAAPALVMYREASETAWQPVTMTSPTSFELRPAGPYLVTLVCVDPGVPGSVHIQQIGQTLDDPRALRVRCDDTAGPLSVRGVAVAPSGTASGDAWVAVGGAQKVFPAPAKSFEFRVLPGAYDVFVRNPDALLIRRRIQITADRMFGAYLDPMAEGMPMVTGVISVFNGVPTENLTAVQSRLETSNGAVDLQLTMQPYRNHVALAPNDLLEPADVQTLTVQSKVGPLLRGVRRKVRDGDSLTFTLPPFLEGLTLSAAAGVPVAAWPAPLPDHTRIQTQLQGTSADSTTAIRLELSHSRRFAEATGLSSTRPHVDIPGYPPAWILDVTRPYYHSLIIERDSRNDTLYAGKDALVGGP